MKVHWQPAEAVSWSSGGKRNPQMRTFLLPGNIVCHADGFGTSNRAHVTCGNCLSRMRVESPYASNNPDGVGINVDYARACLRDCLQRGEAPFASHLLYTQRGILDDSIPEERALGIEAGLCWGRFAQATVVYVDRGVSPGMAEGIARARSECRPVELRALSPETDLVDLKRRWSP
jgi:hypothetical protein